MYIKYIYLYMANLYCNISLFNNTCTKLTNFCTSEYIYDDEICKCLENINFYRINCTENTYNAKILIPLMIITFFCILVCIFRIFLYCKYYITDNILNTYIEQPNNQLYTVINNNRNNINDTNFDEIIQIYEQNRLNNNLPKYDEIFINDNNQNNNHNNSNSNNTNNGDETDSLPTYSDTINNNKNI